MIRGREWTVVFRPAPMMVDGVECAGATYRKRRVIELADNLEGDELYETLLHEALHAAFPEALVTDQKQEQIISNLDAGLWDVVRAMTAQEG
jgi:hypothetical protein